jgi:chromosome segregation ATPase
MIHIEKATQTLDELTLNRDALVGRGVELEEQRQRVAYAAHTGDVAARKRLDTLNRESGMHASELASLDAAIAEATARLEAARKTEATAADRAKGLKLRDELLPRFIEHGRTIDSTLKLLVEESDALVETLRAIHALGAKFPSEQQLQINAGMVIATAMMASPWHREFRHLAPHERRTFANLLAGQIVGDGVHVRSSWTAAIERHIKQLLGETADAKEDAA